MSETNLDTTLSELKTSLEATGYKVLDYVPEAPAPRTICMSPGDPYVTPADEFNPNRAVVNFDLVLVAKTAENRYVNRDINQMITKTLVNLDSRWSYQVNQPLYGIVANDYKLYAVINVSTQYEIED